MAQYEFNLQDYIRIVKKRIDVIVVCVFIFLVTAIVHSSMQKPVYEAVASIKVQERKTVSGMLTEWIMATPGDIMESQAKVIVSFPVLKRVALRKGYVTEDTTEPRMYEIVGGLQGQIETERIGITNIVKIIASSDDAAEAQELANMVAQEYGEYNLEEKKAQAHAAREFIEEQLMGVEKRLEEAEEHLRLVGQDADKAIFSGDLEKRLGELKYQLVAFLQKYTEKHPRVVSLREEIAQLESQLRGFSHEDLDYTKLTREVEVNRELYAMLREKLEEIRITEAEKVADVAIVDPALLPGAPLNNQTMLNILIGIFLGLTVGLFSAFIAETLDASVGTIDDVERLIQLPVVGVVPSITYEEVLAKGFLRRFTHTFFPRRLSEEERQRASLISHYLPDSPIAESFRNIMTNIKLLGPRKRLLVTSAGAQEGKSTLITNLAIVFAQEGNKTILVSADLRRPTIEKNFGLSKKPGLTEVITGSASFEEACKGISDMLMGDIDIEHLVTHPGLDRLWIVPAGSVPLNPVKILDSHDFDSLLERLDREYDIILLDSPPVLSVADATVLSRKVQGTILCYEAGRTSRHALARVKTQLESAGAKILGVVLNHTRRRTEMADQHPSYYHYKYYQSDKEKET